MNKNERIDYIRQERARPLMNEDGSLNEFKKSKAQILEFLQSQGASKSRVYELGRSNFKGLDRITIILRFWG